MNTIVDAKGVSAAAKFLYELERNGFISFIGVQEICLAVIARYDSSVASADSVLDAQQTLEVLSTSIRLS